jgi:hypothetical protein
VAPFRAAICGARPDADEAYRLAQAFFELVRARDAAALPRWTVWAERCTLPEVRCVLPGVEHRRHKGLNKRAENSHRPTRRRERALQRFKSPEHAQRFLSPFGPSSDHFRPRLPASHRLLQTRLSTRTPARTPGGRATGCRRPLPPAGG